MRLRILLPALILAICFVEANPQVRPDRPASSEPCPDEMAWTGKYKNQHYGFSIIIPPGRKGFWNSYRCVKDEKLGCVCMTDHGRSIPLSGDTFIDAYAGYIGDPELSLVDYEKMDIAFLTERKGVEQVKLISSRQIWLGRLKARRFVVRFVKENKTMIEDQIIALHKDVQYDLTLGTFESKYQADKREFEKVIMSWKLIPRVW
jgi:hypothetical protein